MSWKEAFMRSIQGIEYAFLRSTILIVVLSASISCDLLWSNQGDGHWLAELDHAEEELRAEGLSVEQRGQALIRKARANSGLGRTSEAVAIWEELRADPGADPVARARATYRLAHWQEGREHWVEAIELYREYASIYRNLTKDQHSSFDGLTENPASLLFHVGELEEFKLRNTVAAESSYSFAVDYAVQTENLARDHLTALYGDFLFRQLRIGEALNQYEVASAVDFEAEWPPSTIATSARVKMVECLCLLGRCDEARDALEPMAKRWAGTEYEEQTGYVSTAQALINRHCSG